MTGDQRGLRSPLPLVSHRWAVVGATRLELASLRCRSHDNLLVIRTGVGVVNVQRNIHALLQRRKVEALFGVGLAGALSSVLRVGDLVVGQEVSGPSRLTPTPELLRLAKKVRVRGASVYAGTVVTVNEVVDTAKSKQLLASTMAERPIACVDMESWAVAQFCARHQIPFLIVRAISDAYDEDLPCDFNRYRRADGNLDLPRIIGYALVHPRSLGGWLTLARNARLCTRRLAQFVEQMTSGDLAADLIESGANRGFG